jgi:hypothetical protein
MERGYHLCKKFACFEDNFKVMFNHGDPLLFNNSNMHFTINADNKSQESLAAFIHDIGSLNIKDKYPDTEELIRKFSERRKPNSQHDDREEEKKESVEPTTVVNNLVAILKKENEEQ